MTTSTPTRPSPDRIRRVLEERGVPRDTAARIAAGNLREVRENEQGGRLGALLMEPGRAAPPPAAPATPATQAPQRSAREARDAELRSAQGMLERTGMSAEAARYAVLGREPEPGDAAALAGSNASELDRAQAFFESTGMSPEAARHAARGR